MRITRITFALLFVIISGLTVGCVDTSSALTPPDSPYPADIIGRVTVAKKLIVGESEWEDLRDNVVYWVIEVVVNNKNYEHPITSVPSPQNIDSLIWVIVRNDKLLSTTLNMTQDRFPEGDKHEPSMAISQGQSGKTFLCFRVSDTNTADAQICYRGQEPYSYGELITDDSVAVYDWDLKKAMQEVEVLRPPNIAKSTDMWVVGANPFDAITGNKSAPYNLAIALEPNNRAIANKLYCVYLYENGKLRGDAPISWNQPELNVKTKKVVRIPITREEYKAYYMEDVSHIFSVEVHE